MTFKVFFRADRVIEVESEDDEQAIKDAQKLIRDDPADWEWVDCIYVKG